MRTVYHSPFSPHSRKVRILLREKNLAFELIEEPFWEGRETFAALNPACEVPVLVDDNGKVICGHYPVSEYLEDLMPQANFLGSTPGERAEVRRLTDWFDHKFYHEVTAGLAGEKIFKRLMRSGQSPSSEAIRLSKARIGFHMDYIGHLLRYRTWLAGERITLADMAAVAQLSVLDYLGDVPWHDYTEVKDWYAVFKSRPSFRAILIDKLPGVKAPEHYEDLDF